MSDKLSIKLNIEFKDTAKTLDTKLNQLIKKLQNNRIDIIADTKKFEQISKEFDRLKKKIENKGVRVFGDKDTKMYTLMFEKLRQQEEKYNTQREQWWLKNIKLREIQEQKAQEKIALQKKENAEKYEQWWLKVLKEREIQELKIQDKIQDAIAQTIKKRNDEERKLNENQSKAINKELEKQFKQKEIDAKTLIGTFTALKKEQLQVADVANVLSKQYGNLEVREKSLDQISGKYTVTLRKSAKENLVLKGSVDKVTGALRVQSQTVEQARNVQLGFWEQFKIALERVPIWLGATTVYFQSMRFGQQLITDIADINAGMIDLEKVSSATKEQLEEFRLTSPQLAKELGVLNSQVIDVTAQISKLGYSLEEAKNLGSLALIATSVGDLNDVSEGVDYLVSTIKGFGLQVEKDAPKIIDFMNHIANTESVSFRDIGQGYIRMSSAMAEANNTLQETTGLFTAGFDITRNAEKTATALRTVSMRLRGLSEDGEAIEGLVPTLESDFAKLGLTLKANDNTFKSTFDILQELSTVWSQMSDFERANILENISGKRNAQVIAAIIKNFETAQRVAGKFEESQGSALVEHQKYMQSVEAAYNNLVNTMTMLNQKLLKSETLIKALNLADWLLGNIEALGKFNFAIIGVVGALGMFTLANRKAMLASQQFQVVTEIGGIKTLAANILTASKALLGFKTSADVATISATSLNIAMGALLLGLPLLAQGIGALINRQKRLREELDKSVESFKLQSGITESASSLLTFYDEMITKYGELADVSKLTAEEKEKFESIEQRLQELLPNSSTIIDKQNQSLKDQYEIYKNLNKEKFDAMQLEAQNNLDKYEKDYEKNKKFLEIQLETYERYETEMNNLREKKYKGIGLSDEEKKRLSEVTGLYETHKKIYDEINNKINLVDNANKLLSQTYEEFTSNIEKNTDATNDNTDAQAGNSDARAEALTKTQLLNKALSELNNTQEISAQTLAQLYNEYPELAEQLDLNKEKVEQFEKSFANMSESQILLQKEMTNIAIEQTKKRILEYQKELKALSALTIAGASLVDGEDVELEKQYRIKQGIVQSQLAYLDNLLAKQTAYENILDKRNKTSKSTPIYDRETSALKSLLDSSKITVQEYYQGILKIRDKYFSDFQNKTAEDLEGMLVNEKTSDKVNSYLNLLKEIDSAFDELEYGDNLKEIEDIQYKINVLTEKSNQLEKQDKIPILKQIIDLETQQIQALEKLNAERKKEMDGLDKNSDRYQELKGAVQDTNLEMIRLKTSITNTQQTIKDLNEEYVKLQRERLENLADVENQIVSIMRKNIEKKIRILDEEYKADMERLDERHQRRIDSYDEDLREYREYIDKKLGLLDDQYAEEDFLEQLRKEREKANEIQQKINELALSDDRADIVKRIELEKQLAEQEESITKLKENRERDLRRDNLQDQLKDYENHIDKLKRKEDDKYNYKKSRLEREYEEQKRSLERQLDNEKLYAEAREKIMEDNFESILELFKEFQEEQGDGWSSLGDIIESDFIKKLNKAKKALQELDDIKIGADNNIINETAIKQKMAENSAAWHRATTQAEKDRLHKENLELGRKIGGTYNPSTGEWKFAKGGETNITGWHWLDGKPGEPERVLSSEQTKSFNKLIDYLPNIMNYLPKINVPKLSMAGVSGINIDSPVYISGNVDKSVIPNIKNALNYNNNKLLSEIKKAVTTVKKI